MRKLTEDEKKRVLDGARKGLSWATCAGLVGVSRKHFIDMRRADPELDAGMARGLAEWDAEMDAMERDLRFAGEFADADLIAKHRARRLPQLYSPDAKMRTEVETMVEDLEAHAALPAADLTDAILALLAAKKSGQL